MPANYTLLEKITVGAAGASSVTFSGIPQTGYTDLVVKCSFRSSADNITAELSLNGVKTNMTQRYLQGTGSAAQSNNSTAINVMENPSSATASTFASADIYIPNYTSSDYKSISIDTVTEKNATDAYMRLTAGLWSNTAAITSIGLNCSASGNFVQFSTFYLYGVAKLGTTPAIVPYATGGDTIMTDGTYWYHAFKSSGTFTPAKGLSADILTIAGGGGAGTINGGGGGAGGVLYTTSASLGTSNYTVTVGAGGATNGTGNRGLNASNSVFASYTAIGGGGGGGYETGQTTGGSGGSGGGAGALDSPNYSGGSATSGQGFAGGNANSIYSGAGGGGAGAVGSNSTASVDGTVTQGGAGTSAYSSWASVTGTGVSGVYARGGNGIYGSPGTNTPAQPAGVANTGQGGGAPSAGGSGIVIVRYLVA